MAEGRKAHGAVSGSIGNMLIDEELVAGDTQTFGEPFLLESAGQAFGGGAGTRAVEIVGVIDTDQKMYGGHGAAA